MIHPEICLKMVDTRRFRVRDDGVEVWRATPPGSGPNSWTAARIEGDEVVAHSWSGFRVRLDLATGTERERIVTK
jgi:hypothetical protein